MTLESELETIRTNIVTNLTSKGVTASNTESLNDLVGKVNTVNTPITSSLVLKETYQNDISGVVDCLRDKFRINLSKQGVETLSTDGLTTLSNSISLIKQDTVLTLTSDKTSASTGETVTLTATLVDINGNAVNGATIEFMEGNTTLYSSITNNLGVANYSYSSSKDITIKAVFNGNVNYNSSVSSNITINNYLFYDTCSSSTGLSNYTQRILESGATTSLTYDSNMNAYKMTASSALGFYGINNLNNLDNFTLTLQLYGDTAVSTGLGFTDLSNGTGLHYGIVDKTYPYAQKYANGTYNGNFEGTSNGSISKHKWYTLTLKKTGTNIILTLTDPENTGNNGTYTTTTSTSCYYGFTCYNGTAYIRNISAVSL